MNLGGAAVKEKLSLRQRKFAEYYAQSGNTVQSAIKAGYSEKYANGRAYELLENVGVAEYIRSISDKQSRKRIISALKRQEILSDIAINRDNMQESADIIRAIDLLNKMTGEYLNKIEVSASLRAETSKLDDLIKQMSADDG